MLALKRHGVLVIAGLLLVQLVATPQSKDDYTAEELSKQRREYSVALFAKLLCSGVFVIGRDADEFIKNDLARGAGLDVPGWDEIDVTIDRARRSVTLTVEGVTPRIAIFAGDLASPPCAGR